MTEIIVGEDCGNSPKNIFLEKITSAFAKRDTRRHANYIVSSTGSG